MTADEPVAGVPRLCARRADCTRPRGHDDECGPDRADTELADLRAEVERANRVIAEYERKVWRRDQRLLELEGVARTNAAWVQQQHAAAKEAREQVKAVRALHQRRDVFGMCPDDGCERTDCVEYDTCTYLHEDDLVRSECHHCMDADEEHAEWPCPTMAALNAVQPADQPHPTPEADEALHDEWRWRNPDVRGLYGSPGVGAPRRDREDVALYEDDILEHRRVTEWREVARDEAGS